MPRYNPHQYEPRHNPTFSEIKAKFGFKEPVRQSPPDEPFHYPTAMWENIERAAKKAYDVENFISRLDESDAEELRKEADVLASTFLADMGRSLYPGALSSPEHEVDNYIEKAKKLEAKVEAKIREVQRAATRRFR